VAGGAGAGAPFALLTGAACLGPAAVAGYGLYVLALAWAARRSSPGGKYWLTLGVPLCLRLDNLVAGAGVSGAAGLPAAVVLGAVSGGLVWLGFYPGAVLARWVPARAAWLGGALLLLVAAGLCWRECLS
jgi:putative Mn2+ efflux pump MntP